MIRRLLLATLLIIPVCSFAQGDPLFLSDEPLAITFEFPVGELVTKAGKRPELAGVMRYRDPNGQNVAIDMTMTTRGHSRLEYCRFPPLKINLKKGQTEGTIFEGQNKLKIVTHCRNGGVHERYLRQEFSIYKAYNELTDYSFRARWIEATYRDSEDGDEDTHFAFFIESNREIAARTDRDRIEMPRVPVANLSAADSNVVEVFQYLIANTDWSMIKGPGEEGCCHNGKVLAAPDTTSDWVVIPYDFDQAGLINTRYASPSAALGIRSVRQRVYRGRCEYIGHLDDTVALFNEKRADMEQHLVTNALEGGKARGAASYIDSFYEIINDPKERDKRIYRKCRGKHLEETAP